VGVTIWLQFNGQKTQDHPLQYHPEQIASYLIQEHGLDGANSLALEQVIEAQADPNLYALSIWREVKRFLKVKSDIVGHTP
jgi:hypothetical protein